MNRASDNVEKSAFKFPSQSWKKPNVLGKSMSSPSPQTGSGSSKVLPPMLGNDVLQLDEMGDEENLNTYPPNNTAAALKTQKGKVRSNPTTPRTPKGQSPWSPSTRTMPARPASCRTSSRNRSTMSPFMPGKSFLFPEAKKARSQDRLAMLGRNKSSPLSTPPLFGLPMGLSDNWNVLNSLPLGESASQMNSQMKAGQAQVQKMVAQKKILQLQNELDKAKGTIKELTTQYRTAKITIAHQETLLRETQAQMMNQATEILKVKSELAAYKRHQPGYSLFGNDSEIAKNTSLEQKINFDMDEKRLAC